MTSSRPVANHRPPPLPTKPAVRPRNLKLNFEDGQLRKRINLFEGISSNNGGEGTSGDGSGGMWCRQPRVVSPEQKRWTQLDVSTEEPSSRKEVLRQRPGQHSMHPSRQRSPMSPAVTKPLIAPRLKMDIPVAQVNGQPPRNERLETCRPGVAWAKKDENVRNSVLALVSAFETGASSGTVVERRSKMLTVPEVGRKRMSSESTASSCSETNSLSRSGSDSLKPPSLSKRKSRSMDSLVQEFETVAFELSRDSVRHKSDGSASPDPVLPPKPQRTFDQDIYDRSKLQLQTTSEECRQKPLITRLTKPRRTFAQDEYDQSKVLQLKQTLSNRDTTLAPIPPPRVKSAKTRSSPREYSEITNFFPDNNCSRNCNHNGEMESVETPNGFPRYEAVPEFFPQTARSSFDSVVLDNNNQTSILDVLKSPLSRRPKITPPPPPSPSPSPSPGVTSPTTPTLTLTAPPDTPLSAPHHPKLNNGISTAPDHPVNTPWPPKPLNQEQMISPEAPRRHTDGALLESLSPRARRKHPGALQVPGSPKISEYAEPITIRRSLSDENLRSMRRPKPIEDGQGYSVPGSHLWEPLKSCTMRPKSSARLVIEQRPHLNTLPQPVLRRGPPPKLPDHPGIVRSRDMNSNGKSRDEVERSNKAEGLKAGGKKEGGFRQRSKLLTMRRKINDAFRRKHHAQKTEEDRISVTSEGSDSEVNESVLKKRLTYVRAMRLRSSVYCTMQPRLAMQYSKLYEYAVIVSLKMNEATRRYEPYEMKRFPYEVSDSQTDKLRAIPEFCFPDAFKWAPVEQYNSESFCFVLTSSDGSRLYGYNRRILPPGKGPRLPEVVCVMSPIGCYPIYNQLLDEIENRRKHSISSVENLLKLAYESSFPRPGSHSRIATPAPTSGRRKHQHDYKPLLLQRPQDQRLEHVDFDTLFNCLSVPRIVQIFASLLLERRVIMCSGKLSKLSRCSQALAGLLYPFSWQHVYVPVLPEKLIDMCCSPTPYIMGMLSLCIPRLEEMPLEEVLVVDLDARDFYTVIGDEDSILPKKLSSALERALKVCSMSSWEGADTDDELSEDHEAKNSAISEAFIRFFVETVGHYSYHFTQTYDGEQRFDREGFVKAVSSKSVRNFLEVFSETQMFSLFIQEKESESEGISQGLFERRVREFENESKSNSKNISAKMKKIGKAVKEIKESGLKRMKQNLEDKV